jgi:hypothetical protein
MVQFTETANQAGYGDCDEPLEFVNNLSASELDTRLSASEPGTLEQLILCKDVSDRELCLRLMELHMDWLHTAKLYKEYQNWIEQIYNALMFSYCGQLVGEFPQGTYQPDKIITVIISALERVQQFDPPLGFPGIIAVLDRFELGLDLELQTLSAKVKDTRINENTIRDLLRFGRSAESRCKGMVMLLERSAELKLGRRLCALLELGRNLPLIRRREVTPAPSPTPMLYILNQIRQDQFLNTFLLFLQIFRYFRRTTFKVLSQDDEKSFSFTQDLLINDIARDHEHRSTYSPVLRFWTRQLNAQTATTD